MTKWKEKKEEGMCFSVAQGGLWFPILFYHSHTFNRSTRIHLFSYFPDEGNLSLSLFVKASLLFFLFFHLFYFIAELFNKLYFVVDIGPKKGIGWYVVVGEVRKEETHYL